MNQHGKNKLKMYKAVQVVCTAHQADWNGMPAFANTVASFENKLQELQQAIYKQSVPTAGITTAKDQLLEQMIARAGIMLKALKVYAADQGNAVLAGQLDISKKEFTGGGSQATLNLIDRILERAVENAAALADYGIGQQDIDDYATARDELAAAFGNPRNAIIDRKLETRLIRDRIAEIDTLLKEHLDLLIDVLKADYPAFHKRFRDARIILDQKGKKNNLHKESDEPGSEDTGTKS